MWVDSEGVVHTCALSDPRYLMTPAFEAALLDLVSIDRPGVDAMLDDLSDAYFRRGDREPDADEAVFVDATPPCWLLYGAPRTATKLRQGLLDIEDRWQLDVVEALSDVVDTTRRRWRPPEPAEPMPEQLRQYDGLAAEVLRSGQPQGHLLVTADAWAEQGSGHFWWAKHSPYRWGAHVWSMIPELHTDPAVADNMVPPADLQAELEEWHATRLRLADNTYELRWLDRPESALIAERALDARLCERKG